MMNQLLDYSSISEVYKNYSIGQDGQIPYYSKDTPEYSLVKLRCIVQDNGLPTEFMNDSISYMNIHTGQVKQVPSFVTLTPMEDWKCMEQQDMDMSQLVELQTFFCTDIPTESTWFESTFHHKEDYPGDSIVTDVSRLSLSNVVQPTELSGPILMKMPHPKVKNGYVLKMINNQDIFKLNEMLDVVGILEFNKDYKEKDEQDEYDLFKNVAIIHVLNANRVELKDLPSFYPFLSLSNGVNGFNGSNESKSLNQKVLLNFLTNLLDGDALAAEYLLLHLLSRISARHSGINSGYMALNLCRLSKSKTKEIFDFIKSILPLVSELQLSLTQLNNEMYMIPEMDRNLNVQDVSYLGLCSGRLQVADGTCILVDETAMESGTLQERGIMNLTHLAHVMDRALVPIQLGHGSTMELESEIKFLVASEGKSMFPMTCIVPVQGNQGEPCTSPQEPLNLEIVRDYLHQCMYAEYHVSQEMAEYVTNEFATMKQEYPKMNGQDLLNRLEYARLLSKSIGNSGLEKDVWEHVVELDLKRTSRLLQEQNESVLR